MHSEIEPLFNVLSGTLTLTKSRKSEEAAVMMRPGKQRRQHRLVTGPRGPFGHFSELGDQFRVTFQLLLAPSRRLTKKLGACTLGAQRVAAPVITSVVGRGNETR